MGSETKTDNSHLEAKLKLRRYFLNKYHADGDVRVFDCCQGSGIIWEKLRGEYQVQTYWGVDLKPKKGRVVVDSARVLQCGLTENVVDIDTYGSPWKHYFNFSKTIAKPVTVFLTWGIVRIGGGNLCKETMKANGWSKFTLKAPKALFVKLEQNTLSYLLSSGCKNGNMIIEAKRMAVEGNAIYIGLRILPGGAKCQ